MTTCFPWSLSVIPSSQQIGKMCFRFAEINITEHHSCFAEKTSPWLINVCMNTWKSNFGLNIVRADLGTITFFVFLLQTTPPLLTKSGEMVSRTSHMFYIWNNIYLWIDRNNFTWQLSFPPWDNCTEPLYGVVICNSCLLTSLSSDS